jgi:hypothetical protein
LCDGGSGVQRCNILEAKLTSDAVFVFVQTMNVEPGRDLTVGITGLRNRPGAKVATRIEIAGTATTLKGINAAC